MAQKSLPASLETGFRLWLKKEDVEYEYGQDVQSVEYRFWDFGIKNPVKPKKLNYDQNAKDGAEINTIGAAFTLLATIL